MTQSGMPTRIAMPCPFAGADGAALGTIGLTSGDSINFPQGFPSVYGSPASEGGKYVKRAELNAVGNIATNDLFYHKCGGLNTFDKKFCDAIGGYPRGAVLDYIDKDNYSLFKIISLKDNNKIIPNNGTINAIDWAYLNVPDAKPSDDTVIAKFSLSGVSGINGTNSPIGIFRSDYSGYVLISDTGGKDSYSSTSYSEVSGFKGIGILGNTFSKDNIDNIAFPTFETNNNFKWLSGLSLSIPNYEKLYFWSGSKVNWQLSQSVLHVDAGEFVALAFVCGTTVISSNSTSSVATNTISGHNITVSVV